MCSLPLSNIQCGHCVRIREFSHRPKITLFQIVVFVISALAAATRLWQWRRLGEARVKIWRYYGHFALLMLIGSAFGIPSSILYGNLSVAAFETQQVQGASDGKPCARCIRRAALDVMSW
jgi:hypothetical protein